MSCRTRPWGAEELSSAPRAVGGESYPGMVTRIIATFDGYVGKYAWHCHLAEHEANEMMRPFEVLPA